MIHVTVLSQNHSEASKRSAEWLISCFGSHVNVVEALDISHIDFTRSQPVILLLSQNPEDWDSLLAPLSGENPQRQIIACIETNSRDHIGKLLDADVDDVILLPVTKEEFVVKVKRLLKTHRFEAIEKLEKIISAGANGMHRLVGNSRLFLDSIKNIPYMSQVDSPVLITGETGTGKELCARAVHYLSRRADKPFIPVNCGAIPESLFENELFGHERGAYTDACAIQRGLLAEVNGGTLFLDEVSSLTASTQVKLLRFLEEGKYKPLGSAKYVQADVRIVCAANVDLQNEVREGNFRQDLFYRINVLNLYLPPLRLRKNDIPLLAKHFLEKFSAQHSRGTMYFSTSASHMLVGYEWFGNVRELRNVVERAVVMSPSSIIHPSALAIVSSSSRWSATKAFREERDLVLKDFEKDYLQRILHENGWNVSRAASQAQIDRRSFQRMMRKHELRSTVLA